MMSLNPTSIVQTEIRFGLRFKILLALTLFNAVAITLFTVDRWTTEQTRIREGLEQRMEACARALPAMLPTDYLDRAVSPDAIPASQYSQLLRTLSAFCQDTGLRYLYTYTRAGESFHCTASNATPEEQRLGTSTPYWSRYNSAPKEIFEAWDSDKPVYSTVVDEWGTFYTLFLPLRTEAGTRYIAGVDLPIDFVSGLLAGSMRRAILLGLLCFVLFFLVSYWAASRVSRQIALLSKYTHELTASNFSGGLSAETEAQVRQIPETRKDEIGSLARDFLGMEKRLQSYLVELTESTAARERAHNELRIAGDIQASMLPQSLSALGKGRCELAATMRPAKEAGGDFYDVIPLGEDHLMLVIADVSDKGMPAALFMAATVTTLRARATPSASEAPERLLGEINELLLRQNPLCQFVTLFLGVLHLPTGVLRYSNAGHNRPYLRRKGTPATTLPQSEGCALGVRSNAPFEQKTVTLQPSDLLVLYTDGVTEAMAADNSLYGESRLETLLATLPAHATATSCVAAILQDLEKHTAGHPQTDDITLLVMKLPASPATR